MSAAKRALESPELGDDPRNAFRIPELPDLQFQPTRISDEDAVELRWFFGDPQVTELLGGAGGAGSFGRQLERAAALGYGTMPCRRCGGHWSARRRPKNGTCGSCTSSVGAGADKCPNCRQPFVTEWVNGTGLIPRTRSNDGDAPRERLTYAEALARYRANQKAKLRIATISRWPNSDADRAALVAEHRARGLTLMAEAEFCEAFPALPEEQCRQCPSCKGAGVVARTRAAAHAKSRVTAWPTGSSKQFRGTMPDDEDALELKAGQGGRTVDGNTSVNLDELERYLQIERALKDAAGIAPLARAALECFFQEGRLALRELTPTGAAREQVQLEQFMAQVWNFAVWGAQ